MSFYKRYELAKLIHEGDAKTFRAVEIATGRDVLLHLLAPSATNSPAALREIVARAQNQPQVIEVGEFAGSYYIATEPAERLQSFRQWLDSLPAVPATPKIAPQPLPAPHKTPEIRKLNVQPASPTLGEFTEVFGVPKANIGGANEPGEFTKLFYGEKTPKAGRGVPEVPPEPSGTGEFTRFFRGSSAADEFKPVFDAPLSEPEDEPPLAAPAQNWHEAIKNEPIEQATGEYTKFFGNSLPAEPVDIPAEQARQASLQEPKQKPFRQASDFTRMFGPEAPPGGVSKPASASSPVTENTSVSMIFGSPKSVEPAPPKDLLTPTSDATKEDVDDYARVTGGRPEPLAQAPPPAGPPAADRKRTGLIVILVVVGTLLISLLVWVFVSRGMK